MTVMIPAGLDGAVTDVIAIDASHGAIQAVRIVRNPDKLRHLRYVAAAAG
jgi:hypothetical protein